MTEVAQRWREGRDGFVLDLDRGVFDPSGYEVVHIRVEGDDVARRAMSSLRFSGGV